MSDENEARQVAMAGWLKAGLGDLPLPESREEFAALPLAAKLQLQSADPALFELFCPPRRLPAELEVRLAAGKLTQADGPLLEAAGHLQAAQQLKDSILAQKVAAFEEGQRLAAEARQQADALAEAQRLASAEREQAAARADWVASFGGRPNPRLGQAIALGGLTPGARG